MLLSNNPTMKNLWKKLIPRRKAGREEEGEMRS